ncbi:MAG: hypothetical protein AAB740_04220, partial [Patescibacteria group bacterium]
ANFTFSSSVKRNRANIAMCSTSDFESFIVISYNKKNPLTRELKTRYDKITHPARAGAVMTGPL